MPSAVSTVAAVDATAGETMMPFDPLAEEDDGDKKMPAITTLPAKSPGPSSPSSSPKKPPPEGIGNYIAVRIGRCVAASSSSAGMGGGDDNVITIKSAIFLDWDNAQQFLQAVEDANAFMPPPLPPLVAAAAAAAAAATNNPDEEMAHSPVANTTMVEYKRFTDITKAERYLRRAMPNYDPKAEKAAALKKKKALAKKLSAIKAVNTVGGELLRHQQQQQQQHQQVVKKNFNPPTKKWLAMYNAALSYATAHNGDLSSVPSDEHGEYADLYKWIKYQRQSYRYYLEDSTGGRHSMTEEKVNKLSDAGFTWIVDDKVAWESEMSTTPTTPGKRGRPRKTMAAQSILHDESILLQSIIDSDQEYNDSDVEEDGLLQQMMTTTANRPMRPKWLATYEKLKEYKLLHGTIEPLYSDTNNTAIGSAEDNNNNNEELTHLKSWVKNQRNMQARWKQGYDTGMTKEKEDMLKELGMEFAPSWEDMYTKLSLYKLTHGNIHNAATDGADPILASWMARQNDILGRHLSGKNTRLTDDQAMRLMGLGFQGGRTSVSTIRVFDGGNSSSGGEGGTKGVSLLRGVSVTGRDVNSRTFDERWDEMWHMLKAYKLENGHCNVPTSSGTELALWVAAQRRMYKNLTSGKTGRRVSLDAQKMQRLTELGFAFRPRGDYASWDDQLKAVWDYKAANGHCRIPVNHPTLGSFVKLVRRDYKNWINGKSSSMTPERETALKEVGFVFEGGKTPQRAETAPRSWEERLEELIQYKAEYGHTVVPQNSGQLGAWVHSQRVHYKRFKAGVKSQMTTEKALRLTEIGFCFNASDRYRGNKSRNRIETTGQHQHHQDDNEELQQYQFHQPGVGDYSLPDVNAGTNVINATATTMIHLLGDNQTL